MEKKIQARQDAFFSGLKSGVTDNPNTQHSREQGGAHLMEAHTEKKWFGN